MQPGFPSNLPCEMQSFRRSLRLVAKLEVGMKSGEVQRHVGSEVRQNPFGKFVRLRGVIIQGWNHQIGDFEPDAGLILQPLQRLKDRLEMSERDFAVEIFGKRLQVDVRRIDMVVDVVKRLASDVAVE